MKQLGESLNGKSLEIEQGAPAALLVLPRDNNRNIEALRGFAALLVCYYHIHVIAWIGVRSYWHANGTKVSLDSLLAYASFPVVWGSIGVPIFFVVSGYCIHLSHATRLSRSSDYRLDVRDFWLKRFIRIYPVLAAALILTFIFDSVSYHYFPLNERLSGLNLTSYLVNLFALQGIAGGTFGSNGALWTLSLEIQFYLFYPLLFIFSRRFGRNITLSILVIIGVVSYLEFERRGIVVFLSYWFSWYLGAYIAELKVEQRLKDLSRWMWGLAAVLLATGCIVTFKNQFVSFQIWAVGFGLAFAAILQKPASNGWIARCLERLGTFSYSLYIIHIPIAVFLVSAIFHSNKPYNIFYSIGFTGIAIAIAFIFYMAVERPTIIYMRRSRKPAAV